MIKDLLSRVNLDKLGKFNLDKLNFDKLKLDKNKIIFIAVGIIFILYLDFTFIIKMQSSYIKKTSPKIIKLKKDIFAVTSDLARLKDLQGRQSGMKQEVARREKKLISEGQIPLLLQFISDAANRHSVSVMQIKPSKESRGKVESKGKVDTAQGASLKISPVSITLVLSCDYHHLGQFINDLENADDLIVVDEVRIFPDLVNYLNQNVSLLLKTYVKK